MERFTLIDGLRGIAALMVVIGHLSQTVESTFTEQLPVFVNTMINAGHFGVEIFFVISGFVIAHSVRNGTWTVGYLARFGLRRSIRLDPPYWLIIILEIFLIHLSLYFFPDLGTHLPTVPQIAAHLVYLQGLLGLGHLLPVFWTLCYEVQFYLVLVSTLVFYTAFKNQFYNHHRIINILFATITVTTFLISLGMFLRLIPIPVNGLFIDRWYQFFLGALAWWCTIGNGSRRIFLITWSFTLAALFFAPDSAAPQVNATVVILCISMLMYVGAISDNLTRWLSSRGILFLGTISYGLYLIHLPVGWRLIALEKKFLGDDMTLYVALPVLFSGIIISLLAAWILHIMVEQPALDLAHKIRMPKLKEPAFRKLP